MQSSRGESRELALPAGELSSSSASAAVQLCSLENQIDGNRRNDQNIPFISLIKMCYFYNKNW
jgi:hypothetical protein